MDELKLSRKEQCKNYDTVSISLDYLRPYDFEDHEEGQNINLGDNNEEQNNENEYNRRKGNRLRGRKSNTEETDYEKKKSEQGARALLRIRRAQERKKKQEEEEAKKNALHKSAKITRIANELEEALKHREEEENEKEEQNDKKEEEEETAPRFSVAGSQSKRRLN